MKKKFKKMDKSLLIVTLIFFVFGLIMILSASSMESYMRYSKSPYYYFFRQGLFLIIGCFAFLFLIFFPTKNYKKLAGPIIFFILSLLIGLILYGYSSNNAQSWFAIGPIRIQPSEFAKIAIIIYMAMYYDKNKDNLTEQWVIIKPLWTLPIICLLIALQPDLGTAIIIGLLILSIFYAVPTTKKTRSIISKILIGAIAIVGLVFVATDGKILNSYQLERLNFRDPCSRYQQDSGYQLCNSFIAFKNGGVNGQGIGESTQKYLYLPESYTDFIFPIIVEEWGLIIGLVILLGYLFILYRIRRIAKRANNLHNSLIAFGVFIYILLHIVINLGGVMGLIPLTGVPLPFLSYGGSYALSLFMALGLVQRVAIESDIRKKEELK